MSNLTKGAVQVNQGFRKRFVIASTCDGYEVQDENGRSMTNSFPTANKPLEISARLNDAASYGRKSLARALGAIELDDEDDLILPDGETVQTLYA